MLNTQNSYGQILKATSLFGAVQVFAIAISIVRSKVIAILIGPLGMGIIGLLTSTIKIIGEFAKLGIDTTAVKEISYAANQNNPERIPMVLATVRKIVWFTGIIAAILTICSSPLLSLLAFDSYEYTLAFVWISISLLLNQLSVGQLAVLQGMRQLKYLAKANLLGNLFGLLVSLPLYYWFGIDAIVSVIILSSGIGLFFSWWYSKKVQIEVLRISNKTAFSQGKSMLKLGIMLSLSGLITLVAAYGFQIYLSHFGGVVVVGYYVAGFMIINSYVGMVFNAMRTDYFPRLSGVIDDRMEMNGVVTQQAMVAVLIITPLIVGFTAFAPFIVELLYSKEFIVIVGLVTWAILGTLFKALSWSMGYVILAKGDSNLFIKTALFFNTLMVTLNIVGYYYADLLGLGISFFIYYILHFIGVKLITAKKYGLFLGTQLLKIFMISLLLLGVTFLATFVTHVVIKIVILISMIVCSLLYSFYELNKRMDLKATIKAFLTKRK